MRKNEMKDERKKREQEWELISGSAHVSQTFHQ
jgi:hypothetical protein